MKKEILEVVEKLPVGTSLFELQAWHLVAILKRNGGNRTRAAEELRICLRTVHHLILAMKVAGYPIPEYDPKSMRPPRKRKLPFPDSWISDAEPADDLRGYLGRPRKKP